MARNSSGVYTLPVAAYTSGTVIKSADMNSNLSDIATALTQSLATTGVSTMTGPVKASSGTVGAPSYTFGSDTTTGFYYAGANSFALVTNGVLAATFNSNQTVTWAAGQTVSAGGIAVTGNSTITGNLTVTGTLTVGSGALPVTILTFTDQGSDPTTPAATKGNLYGKLDGYNSGSRPFYQDESARVFPLMGIFGQCRLTLSGGNLLLSPYFGNLLTIDGVPRVIPDAGVTLGTGGTVGATFYYIYAYMNSGTMTIEASTTVPVAQTGTGLKQKTGDTTRTLVGAAYTDTGPAWADTDGKLWVLSYFNRKIKKSVTRLTADRTTTSATYAELNSEIRNQFISWSDEVARGRLVSTTNSGLVQISRVGLATDGASPDVTTSSNVATNADLFSMVLINDKTGLTEAANHYMTFSMKSDGVNTVTGKGSALAGDNPTYITVEVMG
jgi:hypothetical protein